MTLAKELSERTRARIVERLGLSEVSGPEGGPRMLLKSPMSPAPVGALRVFHGERLDSLVTVSLSVPPIGLDSHMIFAFTPAGGAIPHFTVDAVKVPGHYAFHLDLIPRADLAAYLPYLNATMQPLTPAFEAAQAMPGFTVAALSPRQRALMSPWMLAFRATDEAFAKVGVHVDAYLDHWFSLVERGVSPEILTEMPKSWAARDRLQRAAIFNPETDPVWAQVDRLLGSDVSAKIREVLKGV